MISRKARNRKKVISFVMRLVALIKPGLVRIHAGTVNELEVIKPQADIWVSKKIPSIKIDESLDQFQKNFA